MPKDDTEEFLEPLQPSNGPIKDDETGQEDIKDKKARIARKNLEKANTILKLIKENEKNHKPEPENEPDEPENEDATENATENISKPDMSNYMSAGERGKLLRELRKIWKNSKNKGSEICSAANLYAELQGYKQKTSDSLGNKEILKIIFDIAKPPANKMLEPSQVNTKETKETTTATTTPIKDAQLEGQLDDSKQVEMLGFEDDVDLLRPPTTTLDNKQINE